MSRKTTFVKLTAAALVGAVGLQLPTATTPATAAVGDKVRVMSYNILAGGDNPDNFPHPEMAWSARLPKIVERINAHNPGIVGLQEVNWKAEHDQHVTDALADKYAPVVTVDADGMERPYNANPIFVKKDQFRVIASGQYFFKHPKQEAEDAAEPKPKQRCGQRIEGRNKNFVWARVRDTTNGQRYMVVNTHLAANIRCETARLEEVKQLRNRMKKIIDDNGWNTPILVLGDFNAPKNYASVQRMVSPWEDATGRSLQLRRANGHPLSETPTRVRGWKTGGPYTETRAIDHIYWQRTRLTRVNFGVDKTKLPGLPMPPSDHFPVWGTFRVDG